MTDRYIDLQRRFRDAADEDPVEPGYGALLGEYGVGEGIGWPELLESDRVVLLAEAGSGKTEEMRAQARRLVEEGTAAFFAPVEDLDREPFVDLLPVEERERFKEWRTDPEAPAWFFLDAVDELKLTEGRLDRALRRFSQAIDGRLDRARIVISCRPSDWRPQHDLGVVRDRLPVLPAPKKTLPPSPEEAFMGPLRGDGSFRGETGPETQGEDGRPDRGVVRTVVMLPMDGRQIETFARRRGVEDTPAFLEEIERRDAGIFAGRPLDLDGLIEVWKDSGRLGTRAQQHEANVKAKLKDDPERPDKGVLSDDAARAGAERLALALALTRARTIRSPEQALDADRAGGVLDPSGILPDWTEAERQALLRRALFDPATYGRVRFHHRSVQEYLAARRLRELRGEGLSTRKLFRLLFAERGGFEVVFPSMREVAAWLALWDEAVRGELIRREPEALCELGDPETLDVESRRRLVRAFAGKYGEGGWRGLGASIRGIRRLAHRKLAPTIRECWGDGPKTEDVRRLLLRLIWQGPLGECADLAEGAARDATLSSYNRIVAVRALVECGSDRARAIADSMLDDPKSWPDRVVLGAVESLFPGILKVDELIALMKRIPASESVFDDPRWALQQIVDAIDPRSAPATDLRDRMADLIWRELEGESNIHGVRSRIRDVCGRLGYLAPALARLCDRQLSESSNGPCARLIRACVIASRLGNDRSYTGQPVGDLRNRFSENGELRSRAFWAELDFVNKISPPEDELRFLRGVGDFLTGNYIQADRPWLLSALAEEGQPQRRAVALHALLDLWIWHGCDASELDAIREKLKEDPGLVRIFDDRTAPATPDESIEEREHQDRMREREVKKKELLEGWKGWRAGVLADPDDTFSKGKLYDTLCRLHSWLMEADGHRNRYDVWNKDALAQAFNPEIADRTEEALRAFWRGRKPVLRSARSMEEKEMFPPVDQYLGLMGVSAESAAEGWAAALSPDEARTAAAYATIELNGLAPFIADLAEAYPEEVEEVVGGEVSAALRVGGDYDYLPVLPFLGQEADGLKRLLAPRVLAELKFWPRDSADDAKGRWIRHLDHVLRVLAEGCGEAERAAAARVCAARYEADPAGALAIMWLKGLFWFEAARGAEVLIDGLANPGGPDVQTRAVETFAALFSYHEAVAFEVADPARRAELLGRLVRHAYAFVRREDDQTHVGAYSPNARDKAQHARERLLDLLLHTRGPTARRIVSELADDGDFAHMADWLRHRNRQRAAADADFAPYGPGEVRALEERLEAPPKDRDGLFDVMMDRLEDLAHDLRHGDFSDRRTVRGIAEEAEMQRTLARRLQGAANGAYAVTREEEVADGKRTDIQILAAGSGLKAVLEVKIADNKWTLTGLEQALRDQLVGQYMRHPDRKAGCLLLTWHGRKRFWKRPDDKKRLDFPGIVEFLSDRAREVETENPGIRLSVFGLDLTGDGAGGFRAGRDRLSTTGRAGKDGDDGRGQGGAARGRVSASGGAGAAAARGGGAGAVPQEEAAGGLPVRPLAVAGPRLGRRKPGAGGGRGQDRGAAGPHRAAVGAGRGRRRPGRGEGGARRGPRRRRGARSAFQAVPELGGQGGAAVVRRADPAAVRP